MSNPRPVPPARKPASPPPADQSVPQSQPAVPGILPPAVPHTRRLQTALAKIDGDPSTPSTARSVLSSYFRHLNPTQTTEHLPRALHPHPLNVENARTGATKWDVLCHLLGNAAQALQEAYRLDREYVRVPDTKIDAKLAAKAKVEDAIKVLEARTARLEVLASWGHQEWVVTGFGTKGYSLATKDEWKALLTAEVDAAKIRDAAH